MAEFKLYFIYCRIIKAKMKLVWLTATAVPISSSIQLLISVSVSSNSIHRAKTILNWNETGN